MDQISRFTCMSELRTLFLECLASGQSIRFSPQGVSMLPMLRQGIDSVVLSPVPKQLRKFDLPLYQLDNGKYILHRVIRVEDTYTCMGDNLFTPEKGIRHDQVIALVTGFYRGERFHSVNEPAYRIYCRFWHFSRPLRRFWRRGIGWLRRHLKPKMPL